MRVGVLVVAAGPDHEDAVLAGSGLAFVDDDKASRDIVAVEDAGRQHDDSFNEVIPQEA